MSDRIVVCVIYTPDTIRSMKEVEAKKVSGLGTNILHGGGEDVVKMDDILKIQLHWARVGLSPSPTYQKGPPQKLLDKHSKPINKPQQKVLRRQRCRRYF